MPGLAVAAPPTSPFISEIHYDDAGGDTGEFIEVQLPAGTSSAGLTAVLYNGGSNATAAAAATTYDTDAFPTVTAPANAPAVAVIDYPADGIQNGSPDGIALVDASGTVLEFLSYEGVLTASNGPAAGLTSTDIGVAEAAVPEGQSLSRTYDAGADALVWAGPAANSKGAVNGGGTTTPEEPPATGAGDVTPPHAIGAVQGSGAATPLAGGSGTVRGGGGADLRGMGGFHLRGGGGAGAGATPNGIFVGG